ncbi:MAG: hypothetical protein JXA94_05140 [Parachlamydiales bacterium]|nr:hypothetical protein [Parachlamydiales bacterium]
MSHPSTRGISGLGGQPRQRAVASEKSNSKFSSIGALAAIGITLGVLAIIGFAHPAGFIAVNGSLSSTATSLITLGASAVAVPSLYMLAKRVESFVNGKSVSETEKTVTKVVVGLLTAGFIVTGLVFGGHLIVQSPAYAGALGGSIGLLATLAIEKLSKTKYYTKRELGALKHIDFDGKTYYVKKSFPTKDGFEGLNEAFDENEVYIKEEERYRKLGLKERCDFRDRINERLAYSGSDEGSVDGDREVSDGAKTPPPGYSVESKGNQGTKDEVVPQIARVKSRVTRERRERRGRAKFAADPVARSERRSALLATAPASDVERGSPSDSGESSTGEELLRRRRAPSERRSALLATAPAEELLRRRELNEQAAMKRRLEMEKERVGKKD